MASAPNNGVLRNPHLVMQVVITYIFHICVFYANRMIITPKLLVHILYSSSSEAWNYVFITVFIRKSNTAM